MANIVIVDTSILLNILDVPRKSDQRAEVAEQLRNYIREGDQLFLPIATVLETGNHIAQNGDGNQKRQCALRFVEMVRTAVTDSIPWALAPLPDTETLVSWLDDFPDSAGRGVGVGDHAILKAWKQTCDDFPGAGVSVWSLDGHLQGHDRKPWQA